MSFFAPNIATNIVFDEAYQAFEDTELDNPANQNKIMYLNGTGNLEWKAFDDQSIAELETYADFASLPTTGIATKLYFTVNTGEFYRWATTAYVRTDANHPRLNEVNTFTQSNNFNGISNTGNIGSDTMSSTTNTTTNTRTTNIQTGTGSTVATTAGNKLTLNANLNANNTTIENTFAMRLNRLESLIGTLVANTDNNQFTLQTTMNANNQRINDVADVEVGNIRSLNGTIIASSSGNDLTLQNWLNANEKNIYNLVESRQDRLKNKANTKTFIDTTTDTGNIATLNTTTGNITTTNSTTGNITTLNNTTLNTTTINATSVVNCNETRADQGNAGDPSFTFKDDQTSGLYQFSSGNVSMSAGGVEKMYWGPSFTNTYNPIRAQNGSSSAPSFTFQSDGDSGLYRANDGSIAISKDGANVLNVRSDGLFINSSGSNNNRNIIIEAQSGSNQSIGTSTLVNGVRTINTNKASAGARYFVQPGDPNGGTTYALIVDNVVNGSSFRVRDPSVSSGTNNSTFYWWIIESS
jgi:hypothetical protein